MIGVRTNGRNLDWIYNMTIGMPCTAKCMFPDEGVETSENRAGGGGTKIGGGEEHPHQKRTQGEGSYCSSSESTYALSHRFCPTYTAEDTSLCSGNIGTCCWHLLFVCFYSHPGASLPSSEIELEVLPKHMRKGNMLPRWVTSSRPICAKKSSQNSQRYARKPGGNTVAAESTRVNGPCPVR